MIEFYSFIAKFVTRDLGASIVLILLIFVSPLLHNGLKSELKVRIAYSALILVIGIAVPGPWSGPGMFLTSLSVLGYGFFIKQRSLIEMGTILSVSAGVYAFVP